MNKALLVKAEKAVAYASHLVLHSKTIPQNPWEQRKKEGWAEFKATLSNIFNELDDLREYVRYVELGKVDHYEFIKRSEDGKRPFADIYTLNDFIFHSQKQAVIHRRLEDPVKKMIAFIKKELKLEPALSLGSLPVPSDAYTKHIISPQIQEHVMGQAVDLNLKNIGRLKKTMQEFVMDTKLPCKVSLHRHYVHIAAQNLPYFMATEGQLAIQRWNCVR